MANVYKRGKQENGVIMGNTATTLTSEMCSFLILCTDGSFDS